MKKTAILICMALLSQTSLSNAGGSSSNGGGNVYKKDATNNSWLPIGAVGQLVSSMTQTSQQDLIKEVLKKHPDLVSNCTSDKSLLYIKIPDVFKNKFKIQQKRSYFFGLIEEDRSTDFDIEYICNNERLLESYNRLSIALQNLTISPVFIHLVKVTNQNSEEIPIVLEQKSLNMDVIGGTIDEHSWYDSANKVIHWAPREACSGFQCLTDRTNENFLAHEIAHLFMHRLLKDSYPLSQESHDITTLNEKEEIVFSMKTNKFYFYNPKLFLKTTSEVAYVEGIANALEDDAILHHPFVKSHGDFNHIGENGCFWQSFVVSQDKKSYLNMFQLPKFENELITSSAFELLATQYIPFSENIEEGQPYGVYYSIDKRQLIKLIDIIAKYAPKNIVALAQSIDSYENSNRGYRWLREFFYYDYKTNQNITNELVFNNEQFEYCASKAQIPNFFSQSEIYEQKEKALSEAEIMLAKQITKNQLIENIKQELNLNLSKFESVYNSYYNLAQKIDLINLKLKNNQICETLNLDEKKINREATEALGDFEHLLYELARSLSKTNTIVSLSNIREQLIDTCANKEVEKFLVIAKKFQALESEVLALKSRVNDATHGSNEYKIELLNWINVRKQMVVNNEYLREHELVLLALTDYFKL